MNDHTLFVKPCQSADHCLLHLDGVIREVEGAKQQKLRLLDGVSWGLQQGERVAVLAANRAEADALLACSAGVVPVQAGAVTINAHVSWPLGQPKALVAALTARQNAVFLQRIYGEKSRRSQQLDLICQLSDLDDGFFDQPLRSFNGSMKSRFRLALSLAFDFDVLMVPKLDAWSYRATSNRARRFQAAFEAATLGKPLLVSHPDPAFQDAYCSRAVVLEAGRIVFEGDLPACRAWQKDRKQQRRSQAGVSQ